MGFKVKVYAFFPNFITIDQDTTTTKKKKKKKTKTTTATSYYSTIYIYECPCGVHFTFVAYTCACVPAENTINYDHQLSRKPLHWPTSTTWKHNKACHLRPPPSATKSGFRWQWPLSRGTCMNIISVPGQNCLQYYSDISCLIFFQLWGDFPCVVHLE